MSTPFLFVRVRDQMQQMTLREQLLMLAGLAGAIYLFFDVLVFNAQQLRTQALLDRQSALQMQVTMVSADLAAVERSQAGEFEKRNQELRQLKQQSAQMEALAGNVIDQAPAMGRLISDVLAMSTAGARVAGIKTVPIKSIAMATPPAQGRPAQAGPGTLYKHGLDIELRGNYLDLMRLLAKLEAANLKLMWSTAALNTTTYPENSLRASVFLLSKQANL